MQVTARVDYALRALVQLAAADPARLTRDELAAAEGIPPRYLESVLLSLRQAGLIVGQRGTAGGYSLGRPAEQITVAEVSRLVDGPLALVQGRRPEDTEYGSTSRHLNKLWVGLRAAVRSVMENVTVADLLSGDLPPQVMALVDNPDAWLPH
ncbi:MAG: putative HTH-type transcriptional regulator [Acidimicrobiales bacterium]|nr:MAG: Rrf2 family transcriptional regulator [Actinomycetota bacterium]MBV6510082.1 putative HTH-type transcriptional regulator [Acidimicrobiales bacterium]RIK03576.1 MAG: transcriptional regulator [Acidobacteriota bacterium]